MSKKDRHLYAKTNSIPEVKQKVISFSRVIEGTLNDPSVLRKTSNILTFEECDQEEIGDNVLDRIREKL